MLPGKGTIAFVGRRRHSTLEGIFFYLVATEMVSAEKGYLPNQVRVEHA